nr:restriction endonuclease subunit S [Brucella intermedia]
MSYFPPKTDVRERLIHENEIPSLPLGWDVQRLRFLFRESNERNGDQPVGDMLSVSEYRGVVPREYDNEEQRRTDNELCNYRVVRPGQLAVNTMWLNHLGLGVSNHLGHVSPAYAVYHISPKLECRFVHHLLRSHYYLKIYLRYLYGIRPNSFQIKTDDWNSIPIIVPPRDTQKSIADFLDRETARIDQLIEKKQRQIDVFRESFLASLEVVTTPENFIFEEWIPFRWVCRVAEGQVDPTQVYWRDKPLIAPNHIETGTGRLLQIETAAEQGAISGKYAFPKDTVLYSKIRPALAKACIAPEAGMCSADMYPIKPDERLSRDFLLMQLLSRKFTDWATVESMRVAMPKINRETLGSYRLWVPARETQEVLVKRFKDESEKTNAVVQKVTASINILRELRASLITAAVTGKIGVATLGNKVDAVG